MAEFPARIIKGFTGRKALICRVKRERKHDRRSEGLFRSKRSQAARRMDRASAALKPPSPGDGNFSQMHFARKGITTEEMEYVARKRRSRPSWCATKSPADA